MGKRWGKKKCARKNDKRLFTGRKGQKLRTKNKSEYRVRDMEK